jgi:hypothetical protein
MRVLKLAAGWVQFVFRAIGAEHADPDATTGAAPKR